MTNENAAAKFRQAVTDNLGTPFSAVCLGEGVSEETGKRYMRANSKTDQPLLAESEVNRPTKEALLAVQVKDLQRELRKAGKDRLDAHNVREYILGLSEHQSVTPEWATGKDWKPDAFPGVPMLFLSDFHWGEVVNPDEVFGANSYDMATARKRLETVVIKAARILQTYIKPSKYPGITVVLGGDMVSGDIHDDLSITNEKSIMPIVLDCVDNLKLVLEFLADEFGNVHVVGVPGNHGRNTMKPRSKFYAETNFDWLIYQLLERTVVNPNITFQCPPARDVTFTVAGRRYRLTHGDQFKGGDGIIGPLGSIIRGDLKKQTMALGMPGQPEVYDTLLCGHFHRLIMLPKLIVNSSLKGFDEYGLQNNFPYEPPQQAMWITHPRWGINYYVPIIADPDWNKQAKTVLRAEGDKR